ncbi:MAG: T9SS type A sorting domain-containing protein [Prevotellaceae bacterium]|nr:T9SS type A sorting domain-containing protein [Prevotellaceae bacterium]
MKSGLSLEYCPCGYNFSPNSVHNIMNGNYRLLKIDSQLIIEFQETSDVDISIFSIDGKMFYSNQFAGRQIIIPVENFPKGVYLIKIIDKNKKFHITNKIIL